MSKIWRFEVVSTNGDTGQEQIQSVNYQTDLAGVDAEASASTILDEIMQHYSSSGTNMSVWRAAHFAPCSFTKCRVREQVDWWNGTIGSTAEAAVNLPGTTALSGAVSHAPDGTAVWIKLTTDAASRSGRGGLHLAGPMNPAFFTASGLWDNTIAWWTTVTALGTAIVDALEDVFGIGGTSDILPVIYSETRRRAGLSPYTFQITGSSPSREPRWLRTRMRAG